MPSSRAVVYGRHRRSSWTLQSQRQRSPFALLLLERQRRLAALVLLGVSIYFSSAPPNSAFGWLAPSSRSSRPISALCFWPQRSRSVSASAAVARPLKHTRLFINGDLHSIDPPELDPPFHQLPIESSYFEHQNVVSNHHIEPAAEATTAPLPPSTSTTIEILQRQVRQQQQQIKALLQLLQQQEQISQTDSLLASYVEQHEQRDEHYQSLAAALQHSTAQPLIAPGTETSSSSSAAGHSIAPALFQKLPIESTGSSSPLNGDGTSTSIVPHTNNTLKVMLFVDGTWLYYSIHERPIRECPLIQRYGRGWQLRYDIDWAALPDIVQAALVQQLQKNGLFPASNPRESNNDRNITLDWMGTTVYTSYKADTSPSSYRYKLFQDLSSAQFHVHMMETVGKSEKCVDIQLAVELLHHATLDAGEYTSTNTVGAYDVALLLTGDKDLMPAMIRTRQRGKMLGLVSMRRGCNRALMDTEDLCDFDVIWLEDYLDRLFVPKTNVDDWRGRGGGSGLSFRTVSPFTLHKVITDFIKAANLPRVQSRDLGRYLKRLPIGTEGSNLLDELKQSYGGLYQFLSVSPCYMVDYDDSFKEDASDSSYWMSVTDEASSMLLEEVARTSFTAAEKEFFDGYNVAVLIEDRLNVYSRTLMQTDSEAYVDSQDRRRGQVVVAPQKTDYSAHTALQLKQVCRDYDLPVSGTKAVLMERIHAHEDMQSNELKANLDDVRRASSENVARKVAPEVSSYLKGLMIEYLRAKRGVAGSRDIGRYLNANRPSGATGSRSVATALEELKSTYGRLIYFIRAMPESFYVVENEPGRDSSSEFMVALQVGSREES